MPVAVNILRNVNLFVDGRGYAGVVDEVSPPKLTVKTEEFRAGGMDAPVEIDQGLEKLECTLKTAAIDAALLRQWGVAQGDLAPLTLRGALQSEDGAVKAAVVHVRGRVKEIDWGEWKPGEKAQMTAVVACRYYKLEIDGETVHEIDAENMIRTVDGVDQLAAQRAALSI